MYLERRAQQSHHRPEKRSSIKAAGELTPWYLGASLLGINLIISVAKKARTLYPLTEVQLFGPWNCILQD